MIRLSVEPVSSSGAQESFWASHQPGFRFASSRVGTPEFFAEVERHRYALETHIPEIVGFDRWAGHDVLEVGCGIGTDAARFARAGAHYTGVDPSPSALDLARRRFEIEGLMGTFVEASATGLPFPDSSVDLVFSHGVIHHIAEAESAVSEFHRVLRPGGTALVMVYHRGSLNYRFNIMFLRRTLAALLLIPGATGAAVRLTGERQEVLDGHRQLLRKHGRRYLTDRSLFLSNNTDGPGNPLSKVYSRAEARQLFASFATVVLKARYLNLRLLPAGDRLSRTAAARRLERRLGWHLYIEARKGYPSGNCKPAQGRRP
jgi:ubiquinone/menaquinone biosynthesis C-methylase UbiE